MAMKGVISVWTVLAVGAAFALTQQELQNLVNENNRKANGLMRQITDTCQSTPRESPYDVTGKKKDFTQIESAADELLKLCALKEGAPSNCDAAKVRHLVARAYSEPLNLRYTKEARAAFQEALKAAVCPDDKARVAYDYAKFEYAAAEDDQPEKWEAAMKAAYETPGLTALGKLSLLKSGVPGKDFEKDGWEAVKDEKDAKPRREYFERLLWHTSWQTPSYGLDRTNTPEYWLEVCERAIANLGEKEAVGFIGRRREYLRTLGRGEQVERELIAKTLEVKEKIPLSDAYFALGEHYLAMSKRYYAAPDAGIVKKAVAAMREAYEIRPDGYRREYVKVLVEAKEHQMIVDLLAPTFDAKKPDPWTAPQLGDAYYYLGQWEKAVDVYAAFGDKLNPGERMPPNRLDRRVNALYALGRYEECLKAVDKLSDWLVWKDRKAAYRQKLKAKIAEKTVKSPVSR